MKGSSPSDDRSGLKGMLKRRRKMECIGKRGVAECFIFLIRQTDYSRLLRLRANSYGDYSLIFRLSANSPGGHPDGRYSRLTVQMRYFACNDRRALLIGNIMVTGLRLHSLRLLQCHQRHGHGSCTPCVTHGNRRMRWGAISDVFNLTARSGSWRY